MQGVGSLAALPGAALSAYEPAFHATAFTSHDEVRLAEKPVL